MPSADGYFARFSDASLRYRKEPGPREPLASVTSSRINHPDVDFVGESSELDYLSGEAAVMQKRECVSKWSSLCSLEALAVPARDKGTLAINASQSGDSLHGAYGTGNVKCIVVAGDESMSNRLLLIYLGRQMYGSPRMHDVYSIYVYTRFRSRFRR